MSKYIIEFAKTGTICFTSHLDLMRMFKRAFKRTGIGLAYSQGYNPHPKMGFAQPLSLGYWGMEEFFECETAAPWEPDQLLQKLAPAMPEGIALKSCLSADQMTKTLAAHTAAAEYMIALPVWRNGRRETGGPAACEAAAPDDGSTGRDGRMTDAGSPQAGEPAGSPDSGADLSDPRSLWHSYMDQEDISVWKRQKKKKEPKLIDIRPMIREITFTPVAEIPASDREDEVSTGQPSATLYINTVLDCGSDSNLSPELVISTVCRRFSLDTDLSEISVMRKHLIFDQPLGELLGNK